MARYVAAAAVARAVLVGRLAVTLVTVGVSIRIVTDPRPPVLALITVAALTLPAIAVISRWPQLMRRPLTLLAAETVAVLVVMAVSQGTVAFFCYAAGSAALTGALIGTRGLVLWIAQAGLGLAVAVQLLRGLAEPARAAVTPFLVASPMVFLICGLGAAVLTDGLARLIMLSARTAVTVQRSAAASERARLARELHDSVAKTLHGVSFAAVALPSSLRRHPALAEQLAETVREGAGAAVRETRELLAGLRRDDPGQPFPHTVRAVCDAWTRNTGIPVTVSAHPVEPSVAARYELTQILNEALRNVARHARARQVEVVLDGSGPGTRLLVRDDGIGFTMPGDVSQLSAGGSYGVVGMTERARTVGGQLRVRSRPGAGTEVTVVVPTGDRAAGAMMR